jgi:hypothetical protein
MDVYESVLPDTPLTQGDLLDGCPILGWKSDSGGEIGTEVEGQSARVIVLKQACDIVNARTARLLVGVVHVADALIDRGVIKAAVVRDQIRRGQVFGWYFLPASDAISFPESLVDLRDLHTVPRAVLDRLVSAGKRLGRVATPFREHLAQHFAVTYMRIALPEPYDTRP